MSFSFVQISDHHLRERDDSLARGFNPAYAFRQVLKHIAVHHADHVDFLVTTGDLTDQGTDEQYRATFERMQLELHATEPPGPHFASGEGLPHLPVYLLPGNHDPREAYFRNLFPRAAAREWNNSVFEHKGVRFVCLDWGGETKGVAYPAMLDFLSKELETGTPVILLSHHPVAKVGADWLDRYLADDIEKFWQRVRGKNVLGIFTGHLHMTYEMTIAGIPVYGLRATTFQFARQPEPLVCLQPPHYRIVTVQEHNLQTETVEVEL